MSVPGALFVFACLWVADACSSIPVKALLFCLLFIAVYVMSVYLQEQQDELVIHCTVAATTLACTLATYLFVPTVLRIILADAIILAFTLTNLNDIHLQVPGNHNQNDNHKEKERFKFNFMYVIILLLLDLLSAFTFRSFGSNMSSYLVYLLLSSQIATDFMKLLKSTLILM
jgi:hypothetical protein